MGTTSLLPDFDSKALLNVLESRFHGNMGRHEGMVWLDVLSRIANDDSKSAALNAMESTGGEPDVVRHDPKTGDYTFIDCSLESPTGRRSLCYDRAGLESRKAHKPKNTAIDLAAEMGIELLNEEEYWELQKHGPFDQKTSSWLATPTVVRELGGAIFGDYRFGRVFFYHNGADSYYAARGFRAKLRV